MKDEQGCKAGEKMSNSLEWSRRLHAKARWGIFCQTMRSAKSSCPSPAASPATSPSLYLSEPRNLGE